MQGNKYSDLLEGLNTASSTSGSGRYDDLYLDLLSEEDRKRLQYRYQYVNPAEVGPPAPAPVGAVEAGLREGAAVLEGSRGFFEQLAATPYNLYELGAATLEGREPVYAQPQVEAQQRADAWRNTGSRERTTATEIGAGVGGALGMFPEMLATGGTRTLARAGEPLLDAGAQSFSRYLAGQAEDAARASAIVAPRIGSETAMQAEQAGASLPEALAAGAVETAVTPFTNILPVSAAGRIGSRLATGAVGGVAAEAGVQGAVNPLLPEELRAQRDILRPENLTTAGVIGGLMGAAFGTRPGTTRAERAAQQQRMAEELRKVSPPVADGFQEAARIEAAVRGEITTQETLAFPEREPTTVDMFSGEERPALDPEQRTTVPEELAQAQQSLEDVLRQDREVRSQIAAIEAEPRGENGRLSRSQRAKVNTLRERANQLGIQAEVARARIREEGAREEAAIPSGLTPEETRRNYLLEMQSRQFDALERERLGEMGGLGATETSSVFQPTKPRIRLEPDPVQGSLALPKPRIRAGEDLRQQPVPLEVSRQTWQEGPTGDLFGEAPASVSPARQAQPATTVAPTPQTVRSEAPRPPSVEGPRVVTETSVDPVTGEQVQITERAVSPRDTRRQRIEQQIAQAFTIRPPGEQKLTSPEEASALQDPSPVARVVPLERRTPTPVEEVLRDARTAEDAIRVIAQRVPQESPYRRVMDTLLQSPFLKDTDFRVVQPEDTVDGFVKSKLDRPNLRGFLNRQPNQRNTVFVKGSGFEINGVRDVEASVHEIVHGVTSDLIDGVNRGRVNAPDAVSAVKDLEKLRLLMETNMKNDPTIRQVMSGPERSAVDYSLKDTDEFVAVALSSPGFQVAMKREGIWDKFVNLLRKLFKIPRSDKSAFEQILDAGLSVVEAQTRNEQEVRASRAETDRRILESRQARLQSPEMAEAPVRDMEVARDQVLGSDQTLRARGVAKMNPLTPSGRATRNLNYYLDRLFSSTRGSTRSVREALGNKQGIVERFNAQMAPSVNSLKRTIKKIPDPETRRLAARDIDLIIKGKKTPGESSTLAPYSREVKLATDKVRSQIDTFTNEIRREVVRSYAGRDMPESTLGLLERMGENLGSYVSRTYMSDIDKGFSNDLWYRFTKNEPEAVEIVQPLLDRMTREISGLPKFLEEARQEATALGLDFEAQDTLVGSELRRLHENYVGTSVGRTKKEMFDNLSKFAQQTKDVDQEAKRVAQEIMGVGESLSSLGTYYRGLRTADQPLRKREAVPADIRRVWGEIEDPILNAINTSQRMGAVLSSLRVSNDLAENAPNLFADRMEAETGRTQQVPNNPIAYGQLAGKYTDVGTYQLIVGNMEMASSLLYGKPLTPDKFGAGAGSLVATAFSRITSLGKMASIVYNPFVALSNIFNVVYMPLVNGNIHPGKLPEAIRIASQMIGTAYRRDDVDPVMLEVLEQGIIDPVLTQADEVIKQRQRESRAARRNQAVAGGVREGFAGVLNAMDTTKEVVSFLETLPKIWNYLSHKETFKSMYPNLSPEEVNRLAAEETNRLNLTYARVPDVVKATETLGLSYVAGYMQQVAATSIYSVSSGMRQAVEGIRSGNKQLALYGIKKVGGSVAGYALASQIPIIAAEMFGWSNIGDDEDEDKMALMDTLSFIERGMQPMITGVTDEGVITYTDVGRMNPYDSMHSVIRALAEASGAVVRGENEKAEENLKSAFENFAGQFAGGSPLGEMIVRTFQGRNLPSALENDNKRMHDSLVLAGSELGVSETTTSNLLNALWTFVPAAIRGPQRAFQLNEEDPERYGLNLTTAAIALRAPVRTHNPFNALEGIVQYNYKPVSTAEQGPLREVLLSSVEVTEDDIARVLTRAFDSEAEAFNEVVTGVKAARYVGQMAGLNEQEVNSRIRESLVAGGMPKAKVGAFLDGTATFEPTVIGPQWGDQAIEQELRRIETRSRRTERERELKDRLDMIRRVEKEMRPRRRVEL